MMFAAPGFENTFKGNVTMEGSQLSMTGILLLNPGTVFLQGSKRLPAASMSRCPEQTASIF